MKRMLIPSLALALVAIGSMPAKAQVNGDLSVYFSYTFSATGTIDASGNYPACTAAIIKACISGFNIYDTTNGIVKLGTVAAPSPAAGAIQVTGDLSLTNVSYGTHEIEATAAYLDGNGAAGESAYSAPASFQTKAPQAKAPGQPTVKFTQK